MMRLQKTRVKYPMVPELCYFDCRSPISGLARFSDGTTIVQGKFAKKGPNVEVSWNKLKFCTYVLYDPTNGKQKS